jgi:two-component system, OmpR family, response regulator
LRVLLVEDDEMVGEAICRALADGGMSVDWVKDGNEGYDAFASGEHGVILLDLNLPGRDGLDILKEQRQGGADVPVLILSARDGLEDRIAGLDLGADDYLVKPFQASELLARIRAVVRRHRGQAVSVIGTPALQLDLASHEAIVGDARILLPQREFALMLALLEHAGTILSRSQLEAKIYPWGEEVESNAIDALIYSVRKRLGRDVIRNVRGAGWMVAKE